MKILIVRFRQMGDAILTTVVANSLRQNYPDAQIDLVLNDNIAPLFKDHPALSHIITFSKDERKNTFSYIRKVWKTVHNVHYDVIIDMRSTLNTMLFALFSPSTRYRIGLKKPYTAIAFNHRIEPCRDDESMIDHNLNMLTPLRNGDFKLTRSFSLPISNNEKQDFRDYMQQCGADFERPIVLCGVVGKLKEKTWNEQNMTWLLRQFIAKWPQTQLVFNYAPGEEEQSARRMYNNLDKNPNILIDIQARTMRELVAMSHNITMYFGNEGGARHIVHAAGKPSFVICSPKGNKATWLPKNDIPADGIGPTDFASAAELKQMSYEERYSLVDRDSVWQRLQQFIAENVSEIAAENNVK